MRISTDLLLPSCCDDYQFATQPDLTSKQENSSFLSYSNTILIFLLPPFQPHHHINSKQEYAQRRETRTQTANSATHNKTPECTMQYTTQNKKLPFNIPHRVKTLSPKALPNQTQTLKQTIPSQSLTSHRSVGLIVSSSFVSSAKRAPGLFCTSLLSLKSRWVKRGCSVTEAWFSVAGLMEGCCC